MSVLQNQSKLYYSRSKLLLYFFVLLAFTLTAVYLTINPTESDNTLVFILAPLGTLMFGYFWVVYTYFLVFNKPFLVADEEKIVINSLKFGNEKVLWQDVTSISQLQKNVQNTGKYGSGIIKPKFVEITTKSKKIYLSTNATGKTQKDIFNWLKQTSTNYLNLQNIDFLN